MNSKRFLSLKNSRAESLKNHFFDDVFIEDQKLKDDIMDWITRLKNNKNISINKFSDLFNKFNDIVFPITVSGRSQSLEIKDSLGNEYYLYYFLLNPDILGEYSIGRRLYPYDKEFVYRLSPQNEIVLQELAILQLKEDNTNTDNSLNFCYNLELKVTTAVLETKTMTIEITYPMQNYTTDNEISLYLFGLANSLTHIDDLACVLPYILGMLKISEKEVSLTIKSYLEYNIRQKLLSEICVVDSVVTVYSFTTRPADSMICLNMHSISEELEKFISKHQS